MKRIAALLLLVVLGCAWPVAAEAQIFRGPDASRQAAKAGKKNQKVANKAAKKQAKALRKAVKQQRKAMKRAAATHPRE